MKKVLSGLVVLFFVAVVFALAPAYASEKKAPQKQTEAGGLPKGMELYEHKDPHFTVVVPKTWFKSDKTKNPDCVLRKAYDQWEVTTTEISVADKDPDLAYDELADGLADFFEEKYDAFGFNFDHG